MAVSERATSPMVLEQQQPGPVASRRSRDLPRRDQAPPAPAPAPAASSSTDAAPPLPAPKPAARVVVGLEVVGSAPSGGGGDSSISGARPRSASERALLMATLERAFPSRKLTPTGMPLPELMTTLTFWQDPTFLLLQPQQQAQQRGSSSTNPRGGQPPPQSRAAAAAEAAARQQSPADLVGAAAGLSLEDAKRASALPKDEIIKWMHQLALPLAAISSSSGGSGKKRAKSVPSRRPTPFDRILSPADVPAAFATGALLCVLVERLKGEFTAVEQACRMPDRISGLADQPRTHAARVANFDAALGACERTRTLYHVARGDGLPRPLRVATRMRYGPCLVACTYVIRPSRRHRRPHLSLQSRGTERGSGIAHRRLASGVQALLPPPPPPRASHRRLSRHNLQAVPTR